jgi:hypothetical protein
MLFLCSLAFDCNGERLGFVELLLQGLTAKRFYSCLPPQRNLDAADGVSLRLGAAAEKNCNTTARRESVFILCQTLWRF